jgi:hypothetical protein
MSNEYKPGADISEADEIWTEEMREAFDRLVSQRDKLAEGLREIENKFFVRSQQMRLRLLTLRDRRSKRRV